MVSEVGGGVHQAQIGAYVRTNTDERPHAVVNDFIASQLALQIGLPVPPTALVRLGSQVGCVSLGFGEAGVRPPPVDAADFVAQYPEEAWGTLVFDHWVLNSDRHDENLAMLGTFGPAIFDHDAALIGFKPPAGKTAIDNLQAGLDQQVIGHIFSPHFVTDGWTDVWIQRIRSVDRRQIARLAYRCSDAGLLSAAERDKVVQFLTYRQRTLSDMIDSCFFEFEALTDDKLPKG